MTQIAAQSAPAEAIGIVRAGAVSCLGLSLERHAALVHAKVAGGSVTGFALDDGSSLRAGFVPSGALPPLHLQRGERAPHFRRYHRLLRLTLAALNDVAAQPLPEPPLFMAIPAGQDPALGQHNHRFLDDLASLAPRAFERARSRLIVGPATAFFTALREAVGFAQAHQTWVLVGAADSYRDANLLMHFEAQGRLMGVESIDGFVPAEGACLLLLGPANVMSPAAPPWAFLGNVGMGHEPGCQRSPRPNRGEGLTQALAAALPGDGSATPPVQTVLAGYTGEQACAREWAIASLRHRCHFAASARVQHHVEYCAEAGVAMPALHLATAALHLQQGHMQGPVLVWGLGDDEPRGAAIVHPAPPVALPQVHHPGLARAADPSDAEAWYAEVADTCADEAAYGYRKWRTRIGRPDLQPADQAETEQHIDGLLDLLAHDPMAAGLLDTSVIDGDPDASYLAVRLALTSNPLLRLQQLFGRLRWTVPACTTAIADALVHGLQSSEMDQVVDLLGACPTRAGVLARVASGLGVASASSIITKALSAAPEHRLALIRALGVLGDRAQVPLLRSYVTDPEIAVRQASGLALMAMGEGAHVMARANDDVMGSWAWAFAGGPTDYAALCARGAARPNTRQHLLALGLFGCPLAVPSLIARLGDARLKKYAEAALYLIAGSRPDSGTGHGESWASLCSGLDGSQRYRLGRPYDVWGVLATMQDHTMPLHLRRAAGHEAAIRFGIDCHYNPRLRVSAWQARARHAAQQAQTTPLPAAGHWTYLGRAICD